MTEEKIKQKGIKYSCEYSTSYGKGYKRVDLRKAYIAGATEATKELQMQIDKMKRCENCRNLRFVQIKHNKIISHCVLEKDIYSSKPKPGICNNYDKWELAEEKTVEVCYSAIN